MNIKEERLRKHMKFVKEVNKTKLELLTLDFKPFNKSFIVEMLNSELTNYEILQDIITNNNQKKVTYRVKRT